MRHLKLLATIAVFILIPVGSYIIFKKHNKKDLKWYAADNPTKRDLIQYINASGRLKAQDQITVGSLVAGRVIKLNVDDNDFVKKDQVLVELDDGVGYSAVKKAKAALLEAEAALKYIENFYERQKIIYQSGHLAKDVFERYTKDYEIAKSLVLKAEAELEISGQRYENLFIKAPEDGVIIAKKVDLGQMVTSQLQATELFIIAKDLKKMEAEIDVDEAEIGVVEKDQEAVFTVDAFPQKPFYTKVKQINYDYKVVENVITYAVIFDVENPDLKLRPGMTTNIDIKTAQVKDALCVPNKALRINSEILKKIAGKEGLGFSQLPQTINSKSKDSVWVLEGSSFREVSVATGVTDGRFTQIKSGISTNNKVIFEALDPDRANPIILMGRIRA